MTDSSARPKAQQSSVKTCTKCKAGYPATPEYFYRQRGSKDNLKSWCKNCCLEAERKYCRANPEARRKAKRKWQTKHPEIGREITRRWMAAHPECHRKADQKRRGNPQNRISQSVSAGIRRSLKASKNGYHWEELLGFTLDDLIVHLESQFTKGISWNNYGEWHIDHIRPISSFNFATTNDPEFKECWSLWNLRPLWGKDNMSKGAKCESPPLPLLPSEVE